MRFSEKLCGINEGFPPKKLGHNGNATPLIPILFPKNLKTPMKNFLKLTMENWEGNHVVLHLIITIRMKNT